MIIAHGDIFCVGKLSGLYCNINDAFRQLYGVFHDVFKVMFCLGARVALNGYRLHQVFVWFLFYSWITIV